MIKTISLICLSLMGWTSVAFGKLKVVATTADIAALVREVGAEHVEVTAIAKGSQDPHFIEAKPSFMVHIRDANLVVSNGLSLEIGWLPSLLRGARNPKVLLGTSGHLELGSLIEPIEKPEGKITRAMGDVHPDGNPHFMLDPVVVGKLAGEVAVKLAELDLANKAAHLANAKSFNERLTKRTSEWRSRIEKSGAKKVVTYHPSLNYFLKRFGLSVPIYLEAKPGVPPSAQHVLNVIETARKDAIHLFLVDHFFDTKIADRVAKEVTGAKVKSVGISVGSLPELQKLDDVIEQLVKAIEAK